MFWLWFIFKELVQEMLAGGLPTQGPLRFLFYLLKNHSASILRVLGGNDSIPAAEADLSQATGPKPGA